MFNTAEKVSVFGHMLAAWLRLHDDIIKWKHFLCYWPFVRRIHQLPVNSPHIGQWHGALLLFLSCALSNEWCNNQDADGLILDAISLIMTYMLSFECAINLITKSLKIAMSAETFWVYLLTMTHGKSVVENTIEIFHIILDRKYQHTTPITQHWLR